MTVHEDAGPCSKNKSANCLSWSGLLGVGDEKITKFLYCSSIKTGAYRDAFAWEHLLKDLEVLANGIMLGGHLWKFILLIAKADEETHVVAWGLPSYNAPDEVCSECLADRAHRPYTDLTASARWRPTERMPLVAYAARIREPRHPLTTSKFFTRWMMFLDLMHLADCKGVAAIVFGSLLWFLLRCPRLGMRQDLRLRAVIDIMQRFYDEHPGTHRLPPIRLSNVLLDGWAELHGPTVKAANTRAAAPVFAHLAMRFFTEDTPLHVSLRAVTAKLKEFYDIVYSQEIFMTDAAICDVKCVCVDFGTHFQLLRDHCRVNNILAFKLTPKVHKMQHIPMLCEILNPRCVQCYGEESLIGTTVKVWKNQWMAATLKTCRGTSWRSGCSGCFSGSSPSGRHCFPLRRRAEPWALLPAAA